MQINQVSSTALAAKEITSKDNCACIANISCIEEYGLALLKDNIQDNSMNKTKFWLLSKMQKQVGNKMALIFSTKDVPGALYQVLGALLKNRRKKDDFGKNENDSKKQFCDKRDV